MLLATYTLLLGMQKTLSSSHPVEMKAFLSLSFLVPMLEVAPLSATAEGMNLLRTPSFNLVMLMTCSPWSSSCLLTRLVEGALLSSIEYQLDNRLSFSFSAIALLSSSFLSLSSCPDLCQLVGANLPA